MSTTQPVDPNTYPNPTDLQGATGLRGSKGYIGPTGLRGSIGVTGRQGDDGKVGATGSTTDLSNNLTAKLNDLDNKLTTLTDDVREEFIQLKTQVAVTVTEINTNVNEKLVNLDTKMGESTTGLTEKLVNLGQQVDTLDSKINAWDDSQTNPSQPEWILTQGYLSRTTTYMARLGIEIENLNIEGGSKEGLTFFAVNVPPGLQIDYHSGIITGQPSQVGNYSTTVYIEDKNTEEIKGLLVIDFVIIDNIIIPETGLGDVDTSEGQLIDYQIPVQSSDPSQTVSYQVEVLPTGVYMNSPGRLQGVINDPGTYPVVIRVLSTGKAHKRITFNIVVAQEIVTIAPFTNDQVWIDEFMNFKHNLNAEVSNKQPVTWSISGHPAYLRLHTDASIQGTPSDLTSHQITATATTAHGSQDSYTFTLRVNPDIRVLGFESHNIWADSQRGEVWHKVDAYSHSGKFLRYKMNPTNIVNIEPFGTHITVRISIYSNLTHVSTLTIEAVETKTDNSPALASWSIDLAFAIKRGGTHH